MPLIHIATPGGQQQQLEGSQVHAKWQAGEIPAASLYWKEGMAGWEPISGFINTAASAASLASVPQVASPVDPDAPLNPYAAPAFHQELPAELPPGHYAFVKNPRRLTTVLTVFLWFYLIANVLNMFSDIGQYMLLNRSYTVAEGEANDLRQGIVGGIFALALFPTFIVFGMWIYRAAVNSRGFGAQGMRDSPGWSVGWYFIPFMNLVRPYQCMKEIWQVSGNPREWENQSGSPILTLWWTLWIVSSILDNIVARSGKNDTSIAALQSASVFSIISCVGGIAVTLAALRLVRTITRRQEALVAGSGE